MKLKKAVLLATILTATIVASSFVMFPSCEFEATSSGGTSSDGSSSGSSSAEDVNATPSGKNFSSNQNIYINLTNGTVSVDGEEEEITTVSLDYFDGTVKVKFTEDDSKNSTGVIRVDAEDTTSNIAVYLSGTKSGGGVKIQIPEEYEVGIYLSDVTISSSNYPCLEVTKGGAATVFLSGENTFIDGRKYGYGYGSEYASTSKNPVTEGSDSKGTLYCKGGLSICGEGSLSVAQGYKNCIASKSGYLIVENGTLILKNYATVSSDSSTSSETTGKNGLFGGQGVIVNGGDISFSGKGVISTSDLRKANAFKTDDDDFPSSFVKIQGGNIDVTTYNGKGITAPKVYISGGNSTFNVTGTTSYAERTSSGTYYDADGIKTTDTIKFAAEGVEGESLVEISGGELHITSTDDGINVSATGGSANFSGGYVYIKSSGGDGVDSNGNLTVSGGVIVSIALTGSEDALDWGDGSYTGKISGGFIAGLCGNVESPSVSNGGVVIYNSSTASVSAGQTIAIGSSASDIKYAFTVPSGISSYSNLFMGSEEMSGSSYTVYKNCTLESGSGKSFEGLYYEMPSLTAEGTTGSVSLSSHVYSNGSGMGGGMQDGSGPGGNSGGPGGTNFPGGR